MTSTRLKRAVQPNFRVSGGKFTGNYLPYSVASLWAYASQFDLIRDNYDLKALLFQRQNIDELITSLKNPGVLGFSCYVCNWQYNLALAKRTKSKFTEGLIVMGGSQIPDRSADFVPKHPFADIIVHAEGEYIFRELREEHLNDCPTFNAVRGCTINVDRESLHTGQRERIRNLDELPSPYLAGCNTEKVRDQQRSRKKLHE